MKKQLVFLSSIILVLASTLTYGQLSGEDEKHFIDLMQKYDIPGVSVAVVDNGQLVYAKAFGVKNSVTQEKITKDSPFQAASLSKSVSSALFLRLAEENRLDLDVPINDYLKDWKLEPYKKDGTSIPTARQLMSHLGGTNMSGYAGYPSTVKNIPTIKMVLQNKGRTHFWESKVKVKYLPQTQFQYSGGGYCVLQKAILDLTDDSFGNLILQEVLIPCQMNSSFIGLQLSEKQRSLVSHGHTKKGKPIKGDYHIYPEIAAAGLWTTPTDLAKFLMAIMNSLKQDNGSDGFLSQESAREMIEIQTLIEGEESEYGLGIGLQTDEKNQVKILSHSGSNWGFSCKMYANIQTGKAIVIMINRHGMASWPFADIIMDRIEFSE
jgi:CubicO group peptidase (beta-lactamase class C family)